MPRALLPLLLLVPALSACGFGDSTTTDGSPPAILITKPEGTNVHDVVDFAASVVDEGGVQVVDFLVNDESIGVDFVEPFEVKWNTLNVPDGGTLLKVIAKDYAGNQSVVTKNVTVQNGPN
jgi:hypothetical protein